MYQSYQRQAQSWPPFHRSAGVTDEMVQKEREQILDVTQEDIKALADIVQAVLDTRALCVIGNDQQIRAQESMFGEVKNLYH